MCTSVVKLVSGVTQFFGALVEWRREAQLREDGMALESLKQLQEAANARSIADEIDLRPELTDRVELLHRLRGTTSTTHNLGETDPPAPGHTGLPLWSQG